MWPGQAPDPVGTPGKPQALRSRGGCAQLHHTTAAIQRGELPVVQWLDTLSGQEVWQSGIVRCLCIAWTHRSKQHMPLPFSLVHCLEIGHLGWK